MVCYCTFRPLLKKIIFSLLPKIYLLRPFNRGNKFPSVTIYYQHEYGDFSIEPSDEGKKLIPALNEHDKKQLIKYLNTQKYYLNKQQGKNDQEPIYPIPTSTSSEDAEHYRTGIAGSYVSQAKLSLFGWMGSVLLVR